MLLQRSHLTVTILCVLTARCGAVAADAAVLPTVSVEAPIGQRLVPDPEVACHQQIDRAMAAADSGRSAKLSSDEEFLRRIHLDLIGRSPKVDVTRRFLEDVSPDKRATLIDRLLASDEFSDYMARVLDIQFMERRGGVRIPQEDWIAFLREAVAQHVPYDQIVRRILEADGTGPDRGATKFLLERAVEPNALTRDIGRLFLGRDLQCAQCHDHPNIDDYLQSEYFGIYAFVSRSYLFEDANDSAKSYVGEKADGTTEFKSVFVPDDAPSAAVPHLLGELALDAEPRFDGEDLYVVAPTKDVAGVPRFSRRQQLARLLTQPANHYFARNAVNRMWAHMFGRGLVDPIDFHHGDNPPSHPELLDTLAHAFVSMDYDLRELLRQIALSNCYQRSIDFPEGQELTPHELATQKRQLESEMVRAEAAIEDSSSQWKIYFGKLRVSREELAELDKNIAEVAAKWATEQQAAAKRDEQLDAKRKDVTEERGKLVTLANAATAAKQAAEAIADDQSLTNTHQDLQQRVAQFQSRLDLLSKELADLEAANQSETATHLVTGRTLANLKAQRVGRADMVAEARGAFRVFEEQLLTRKVTLVELQRRLAANSLQQSHADGTANLYQRTAARDDLQQKLTVAQRRQDQTGVAERKAADALAEYQLQVARREHQLAQLQEEHVRGESATDAANRAIENAVAAAELLANSSLGEVIARLESTRNSLVAQQVSRQGLIERQRNEWNTSTQRLAQLHSLHQLAIEQHGVANRASEELHQEYREAAIAVDAATIELASVTEQLQQGWEHRFVVRAVKPLTPEQLAGSTIAGLGLDARFLHEATQEWEQKLREAQEKAAADNGGTDRSSGETATVPNIATSSASANAANPQPEAHRQQRAREIEALQAIRKEGVVNVYVSLFAAPGGAPQDVFGATADQALFFANDGRVQDWLRPEPGTLLQRVQQWDDPRMIADELYLALLSRRASNAEREAFRDYYVQRADPGQATRELAWGLITSLAFRFSP